MNFRAYPAAGSSEPQRVKLGERLLAERRELAESIACLDQVKNSKSPSGGYDEAAVVRFYEIQHRARVIAEHHRTELAEIDAALASLSPRHCSASEDAGGPLDCDPLLTNFWARVRLTPD